MRTGDPSGLLWHVGCLQFPTKTSVLRSRREIVLCVNRTWSATPSVFVSRSDFEQVLSQRTGRMIEQGMQWPDCVEYEKKQTRGRFGPVSSQNSHACASEEYV